MVPATRVTVAVDQDIVEDVRKLSFEDRKYLATGIKVVIFFDNKAFLYEVPKRSLMAICAVAHDHFTRNRTSTELHFSSSEASKEGIREVVGWITNICNKSGTYTIKVANPSDITVDDFRTYQAASTLGLNFCYMHPLFVALKRAVEDQVKFLPYKCLDIVANLNPNDRLFKLAASVFSNYRYGGLIPDIDDFDVFLEKNYVFKQAIIDVDNRKAAQRAQQEKENAAKAQRAAAWEARRSRANMTELQKLRADNEAQIERYGQFLTEKKEKYSKSKGQTKEKTGN
ncbi:hypothetical protein K505DRAFT_364678 [Melanomma pulvis-pyrius CBS 109.77]|uniref:Uncharacterized protein n=1 Tax=Melanomma pulvis-pyrius CBS 109.77 TaxID=1314802 RepID=A0A6A6X2V1_9PLEO|nr:hypothetical protein K505DRAFT_364678 [Melanomma pulvis-pyrius CBS 109.77]